MAIIDVNVSKPTEEEIKQILTTPSIYHVMNFSMDQVQGYQAIRYSNNCSRILRACGDLLVDFDGLLEIVITGLVDCLSLIVMDKDNFVLRNVSLVHKLDDKMIKELTRF